MGLTHCYKTTVFFTFIHVNSEAEYVPPSENLGTDEPSRIFVITGSAVALHCCKAHAKINTKIENSSYEYVTMSYGVFNFDFLSLLLSEILGGPKFTLGGPTPPGRPLSEKFFYPKRVLHYI